MSDDVKLTFFDDAGPVVSCITSHFEGGDGRIFLNIDSDIVDDVIKMRSNLESKWNSSKIDSLEAEHRQLRTAAFSERQFKSMLEEQDDLTSFEKAWGGGLAERFPLLCKFGGGLASTYPGTSRVESDFSILGVEKSA